MGSASELWADRIFVDTVAVCPLPDEGWLAHQFFLAQTALLNTCASLNVPLLVIEARFLRDCAVHLLCHARATDWVEHRRPVTGELDARAIAGLNCIEDVCSLNDSAAACAPHVSGGPITHVLRLASD